MSSVQDFLKYIEEHQAPISLYQRTPKGVQKTNDLGADSFRAVLIMEEDLEGQVQRVSGEIVHWGILEAEAKAAWQAVETEYRVWRDGIVRALSLPPAGGSKDWKKPTEATIEATYRTDPFYITYQTRLQDAELACSACHAMLEGFRAKKETLIATVRRRREDGAPTLSI